jgi:hypothetical protein
MFKPWPTRNQNIEAIKKVVRHMMSLRPVPLATEAHLEEWIDFFKGLPGSVTTTITPRPQIKP